MLAGCRFFLVFKVEVTFESEKNFSQRNINELGIFVFKGIFQNIPVPSSI